MSDPNPPDPNQSLPQGIPAPPPPRPDLKDIRQEGATYGTDKSEKGKKKKKRERNHPTDPYQPLKKSRGCCGCIGGLAVAVVLLVAAIIAAITFLGPGRFVKQGYKVVNLEESPAALYTAPTEPTLYIAKGIIHYRVPVTEVPVALIAREIAAEGDFLDEVSFTAAKVAVTAKARFAKNLEVFAAEFSDLGMTLKGDLNGRVIQNKP